MRKTALLAALLLLPIASAAPLELGEPVVMRAAAVAQTEEGFVGSTATITITAAQNGTGHVFLDTFPLTEVDMQGSARLAARVASQVTGKDQDAYDFFFVVRSGSEQIGGPSAGATMTVGAIAALNGWRVRDDVLMTGTINADGTVGPVGGIVEKATAAAQIGVSRFLFPAGQEISPLGDQPVNVTQHCASALKIECVPVSDVIEAVGLMTDHVLERPPLAGNVTGEDFLARLGPLSVELVDAAQARVEEATAALDGAPASDARDVLAARLEGARGTLERARSAAANGTYYTASSLSFQTAIEARYVREASAYVAASDRAAALEATLARSGRAVEDARAAVDGARIEDTSAFEGVGAAQVRIMEAEERLEAARALARAPGSATDLQDVLYEASYAAERATTAQWWLRLAADVPKGEPVDRAALEEAARDTITTSTEEVAYVEAVFRGANVAGALTRSRDILDDADAAMARGYHAAAMLHALEASVRASVLLEAASFGGEIPASKIETARQEAARAIQGARGRGAESFLAQSAYEFGLSLEDPGEKLAFLGVARVTGNLAGLPGLFGQTTTPLASRFQGIPASPGVTPLYVPAAFAVGLALGVGAGLTALMPRKPEEE